MLPDGPAVADDTARAIHTIILKLKLENCSKNRNFGVNLFLCHFFCFFGWRKTMSAPPKTTVVIITGASRGFGRSTAVALSKYMGSAAQYVLVARSVSAFVIALCFNSYRYTQCRLFKVLSVYRDTYLTNVRPFHMVGAHAGVTVGWPHAVAAGRWVERDCRAYAGSKDSGRCSCSSAGNRNS